MRVDVLRSAWRLFRSDKQHETVIAVVLVAIVVGPYIYREVSRD